MLDHAWQGCILVVGGLFLITFGLLMWRDTHGLLTRYYNDTIRSWRRIPILGQGWIDHTPFEAFQRDPCDH
jgi:hypothetical protein